MNLRQSLTTFGRILTIFLFALYPFEQAASLQNLNQSTAQIDTTYDGRKDKTTVRISPVRISGEKNQYHSVHVAPSFSYPGRDFSKPEIIDFEVQTVVKTKLKADLYVVFVVDGETIFMSSTRSGVLNPVRGKRWIGERLIFRMPYDTLMKIAKARSVEIKMDGVRFPIAEPELQKIRDFAARTKPKTSVA